MECTPTDVMVAPALETTPLEEPDMEVDQTETSLLSNVSTLASSVSGEKRTHNSEETSDDINEQFSKALSNVPNAEQPSEMDNHVLEKCKTGGDESVLVGASLETKVWPEQMEQAFETAAFDTSVDDKSITQSIHREANPVLHSIAQASLTSSAGTCDGAEGSPTSASREPGPHAPSILQEEASTIPSATDTAVIDLTDGMYQITA
jgi:hypothetical protein